MPSVQEVKADFRKQFQIEKKKAECAMNQVKDEDFFLQIQWINSVAVNVNHLYREHTVAVGDISDL